MILDLLTRLAEQRAAIAEAQVALHRLIELGVGDAAQGALEARTEGGPVAQSRGGTSADTASPAGARRGEKAAAKACACCGRAFAPDPRVGDRVKYCEEHRTATARRRFVRAKAERSNGRDPIATLRSWQHGETP